jgi:Holliday junction resolvase RusA-like endonuclease
MSDFVHFKINCVPPKVTAQQKRARIVNGKPVFFKGSKARASEATLEALLAPHQPDSPVTGPVAIRIDLTWPWRASDLSTKAKRESAEKLRWIWLRIFELLTSLICPAFTGRVNT